MIEGRGGEGRGGGRTQAEGEERQTAGETVIHICIVYIVTLCAESHTSLPLVCIWLCTI